VFLASAAAPILRRPGNRRRVPRMNRRLVAAGVIPCRAERRRLQLPGRSTRTISSAAVRFDPMSLRVSTSIVSHAARTPRRPGLMVGQGRPPPQRRGDRQESTWLLVKGKRQSRRPTVDGPPRSGRSSRRILQPQRQRPSRSARCHLAVVRRRTLRRSAIGLALRTPREPRSARKPEPEARRRRRRMTPASRAGRLRQGTTSHRGSRRDRAAAVAGVEGDRTVRTPRLPGRPGSWTRRCPAEPVPRGGRVRRRPPAGPDRVEGSPVRR
jgi:hypothetical protein